MTHKKLLTLTDSENTVSLDFVFSPTTFGWTHCDKDHIYAQVQNSCGVSRLSFPRSLFREEALEALGLSKPEEKVHPEPELPASPEPKN